MKQLLSIAALRSAAGKLLGGRTHPGYVEGLGPITVYGWADWSGPAAPEVAVVFGGQTYRVYPNWTARQDVRAAGKAKTGLPGFCFDLPKPLLLRALNTASAADTLLVTIDGNVLPYAKGVVPVLPGTRGPRQWTVFFEGITIPLADGPVVAGAWTCEPFRIFLHLADRPVMPEEVSLVCDGEIVECGVLRHAGSVQLPEGILSEEDGAGAVTFEFELPGSIWSACAEKSALEICFRQGETRFPEIPITLPLTQASAWLENQALSGPHETYQQMLSIEHAHFLSGLVTLTEETQAYFVKVAREYRLDSYFRSKDGLLPGDDSGARPQEFWRAVRDFNDQVPGSAGREGELLEQLCSALPAAIRSEFVEYLAPYFLQIGRIDVIQPYVPLSRAEELSSWPGAFPVSISLPFFVVNGRLDRATEVLHSLISKSDSISTDAVSAASAIAAKNAHMFPGHEGLVYATISLLDAMAADYWSRHQNTQLMRALTVWLERPAALSTWLWRDLLAGVIRNYGLSEEFWASASGLLEAEEPMLDSLRVARAHYEALQDLVRNWDVGSPWSTEAYEALAYFRRAGSHDYPRILRELVCARLLDSPDTAAGLRGLPMQDLLALSAEECVRISALPVADDAPLVGNLPDLRQTLSSMQGNISHAGYYPLQCRLGRALRRLGTEGAGTLNAELFDLLRDVDALVVDGNQRLAADILARLIGIATQSDGASVPTLSLAFLGQVEGGLREGASWPYQPILAGIASLRRLGGNDRVLRSTLQRVVAMVNEHYGDGRLAAIENALSSSVPLRMRAPAGHDTLVVVYSCRKYLDTRVQAMRDSWLMDLEARGIPYVVVVGDGKDELDGDVLALDVSDSYENLPAKSLAMIRWIFRHTDFQYLLKIDDDCFLNVDEYFDSLSYRKFHYYGRALRRLVGDTDRRWHQEKSQGQRARFAIDKSPEPSTYADGGSGYSLSRLAMHEVLAQSRTGYGRRLIASSYMEDKLVGDLLAAAGVWLSSEDYYTLIRRRFGKDATPIAIWDNTFAPSALSPVKLAHLDTAVDMAPVRVQLRKQVLRPHKLWPAFNKPSLWYNQHQLELLTPLADARRISRESLFVIAVMRNEATMAPHFLGHYRRQGVKAFIIVDNVSDDGTREYLLAQPDVVLYSVDSEYRLSTYGVAWQQTVMSHHCMGKWVLAADADELLVYPDCETKPLTEFVVGLDAAGYDAVRVDMVDMYPFGGLDDADFRKEDPFAAAPWFDAAAVMPWRLGRGSYDNADNYVSGLRHRLIPAAEPHAFTAQKHPLVRYSPWMRFCGGLHNVANARIAPEALAFAHFKYHAGFKAKVEEEVARKQHFGDASEYRKYLAMLAEGEGGFGRPDISIRYSGSAAFLAAARGIPATE